jgi:hypothetical protein
MPSSQLIFSDRVYRTLLSAYPPAFRERFAVEMAQVFHSLCSETCMQSGVGGLLRLWLSAAWDWAWAALYQWWRYLLKQRMETMPTNLGDHRDGIIPLSAAQAGLAALPFLAFGLSSLVSKLGYFHTGPASLPLWQVLVFDPSLLFNWFILIGLGAGLLVGFPRWTYAFLGWALLFAWWWTDMRFYGYTIGWKIWLPLFGVFLVALLIRRSWRPLRALLAGMWRDWTLPSLGFYILYGWLFMLYDENHHPYLLAFIAATTLAISLGAWGYFRAISPLRRVLALLAGLFLAIILAEINGATWDYRAYYGLPAGTREVNLVGFIFFIVLVLLMLGSGLLARWRLLRNSA